MKKITLFAVFLLLSLMYLPVTGQTIPDDFFGQNAWYTWYTDDTGTLPGQSFPNPAPTDYFLWNLQKVKASGVKVVRIGGAQANIAGNSPQNTSTVDPLTKDQALNLVKRIRALEMDVIIQVPYPNEGNDNSELAKWADRANEMVEYINITKVNEIPGGRVTKWIIANEPDHHEKLHDGVTFKVGYNYKANRLDAPELIANYIKAFAIKMREADPNIEIIAPGLSYYIHHFFFGDIYYPNWPSTDPELDFTGKGMLEDVSDNDISGLIKTNETSVPGVAGRPYVNYVSFHYYPVSWDLNDLSQSVHTTSDAYKFRSGIKRIKEEAAKPITINKRTSNGVHYPLKVAITEANTEVSGENNNLLPFNPSTFLAGQWWADFAGACLAEGVEMVQYWSSSEGAYGYLTPTQNGSERSTYHHFKLMADNFKGTFLPNQVTTNASGHKGFGYRNGNNEVGVLIMNQNTASTVFNINLKNQNFLDGTLRIILDADVSLSYTNEIAGQTTVFIKFDVTNKNEPKILEYSTYGINDAAVVTNTSHRFADAYISKYDINGKYEEGAVPYMYNNNIIDPWHLFNSPYVWGKLQVSTDESNEHFFYTATDPPYIYTKIRGSDGTKGTVKYYYMPAGTNENWGDCVKDPDTGIIKCGSWRQISEKPFSIPISGWVNSYTQFAEFKDIHHFDQNDSCANACILIRLLANNDTIRSEAARKGAIDERAGFNAQLSNDIIQRNLIMAREPGFCDGRTIDDGAGSGLADFFVGNVSSSATLNSIVFTDVAGTFLTQSGYAYVNLGEELYSLWVKGGKQGTGVADKQKWEHMSAQGENNNKAGLRRRELGKNEIALVSVEARLDNITMESKKMYPIGFTVSIVPGDETKHKYRVDQFESHGNSRAVTFTGSVVIDVGPSECVQVSAGEDQIIGRSCTAQLAASPLDPMIKYYWHDKATGRLLGEGPYLNVQPSKTTTYILNVCGRGCGSEEVTVTIDNNLSSCNGMADKGNNSCFNEIKAYPNPINDSNLSLELSTNEPVNANIMIVDMMGRVRLQEQRMVNEGTSTEILDISRIPRGVYELVIQCQEGKQATRITKL
jgi:hypothetical protein